MNQVLNFKILLSSFIFDFLDVGFDSKEIEETVKQKTEKYFEILSLKKLEGWELHFMFRLNNVPKILIYTRSKSFPIQRYKEVVIHIPIPSVDQISWGANENQYLYKKNYLDNQLENFYKLEINYANYRNRRDYLIDCMTKSFEETMRKGIRVNKQLVKL